MNLWRNVITDSSGGATASCWLTYPHALLFVLVLFAALGTSAGADAQTPVDYRVTVTPFADTNLIGQSHVFTILVEKDSGNGNGFQPLAGVVPTIGVTGAGSISVETCSAGTDASGQCTVTVASNTPGQATLTASYTGTAADGPPSIFSDSGTKTWVRYVANVQASDTNLAGDPHSFTIGAESENGSATDPLTGGVAQFTWNGAAPTSGASLVSPGLYSCNLPCTVTVNSAVPLTGTIALTQVSSTFQGGTVTLSAAPGTQLVTTPGGSFTQTKTWVSFVGAVTPSTATNIVNNVHAFTVALGVNDGLAPDPSPAPAGTVVSLSYSVNGGPPGTGTCTLDAAGTCTVLRNATVPQTAALTLTGVVSVTIDGVTFPNAPLAAASPGSLTASKTWVNYRVTVNPPTAENLTGTNHVFTVTVERDSGNGQGFQPLAGAVPAIDVSGVGSLGGNTCSAGTSASGQCTVTITSSNAGQTTVTASYTAPEANGPSGIFSDSGVKTWIDYRVTVDPSTAENLTGTNHVFTVTVEKDSGNGNGFQPLAGVTPTITVTGVGFAIDSTCLIGTDASGQCTVTITSSNTGQTTVTASYTGTAADGPPATFSDSGVKAWIDYRVTVNPPTATNLTGTNHVFTVTVEKDSGNGNGFQPLAGAVPATNVTGVGSQSGETCSSGTDGSGQCTVTITSSTVGQTAVTASYMGTAADSPSATFSDSGVKTWMTYRVTVDPSSTVNQTGTTRLFTVTVEVDAGNGAGFQPLSAVVPAIDVAGVGSQSGETCSSGTDAGGQCTVTVTSSIVGQTTVTASFNGTAPDGPPATFSDSGVTTWIEAATAIPTLGGPGLLLGILLLLGTAGWSLARRRDDARRKRGSIRP